MVQVAVKVIDKKKTLQDAYVFKNFRREAKLLQMVHHPNILQLLEVVETDNSYYLITELCSGQSPHAHTQRVYLHYSHQSHCMHGHTCRWRADAAYLQEESSDGDRDQEVHETDGVCSGSLAQGWDHSQVEERLSGYSCSDNTSISLASEYAVGWVWCREYLPLKLSSFITA